MRCATFSTCLADQVSYFKKCGFVLIRRSQQRQDDVAQLNTDILSYLSSRSDSLSYQFWRYFHHVNDSTKRHSVPLPYKDIDNLDTFLHASIRDISPFLNSQLTHDAPLVELSSIISLPGALEQEIHSDISYSTPSPLVLSVMVALSPLTIEKGPTCIAIASNRRECHDKYAAPPESVYYSSDGSIEHEEPFKQVSHENESGKGKSMKELLTDCNDNSLALALLDAGDMLIFDTTAFHFGAANTSNEPRAMLCFSFQNCSGADQPIHKVPGFTYHIHQSTVNRRFQLDDFH